VVPVGWAVAVVVLAGVGNAKVVMGVCSVVVAMCTPFTLIPLVKLSCNRCGHRRGALHSAEGRLGGSGRGGEESAAPTRPACEMPSVCSEVSPHLQVSAAEVRLRGGRAQQAGHGAALWRELAVLRVLDQHGDAGGGRRAHAHLRPLLRGAARYRLARPQPGRQRWCALADQRCGAAAAPRLADRRSNAPV